MYASIFTFALLALVIVTAEVTTSIAYVHSQTVRAAAQVAEAFFPAAEDAYSQVVAQQVQTAVQNGRSYTIGNHVSPSAASSAATSAFCLDASGKTTSGSAACHYLGTYSVTTSSASSAASTTASCAAVSAQECSSLVNTDIGEQRVAATMTVTIANAANITVATKTRTFTLRTFRFAPYVAIVDSAETRSVLGGNWATGATEGDTAGCDGVSGCGDKTTIDSWSKCTMDKSSGILTSVQKGWCDANPTNTGYSHAVSAPQDTYVKSSSDVNETWNNANGSTNGTP